MESRMDQYEIMEQIGRGAFGAAILVNHKLERKYKENRFKETNHISKERMSATMRHRRRRNPAEREFGRGNLCRGRENLRGSKEEEDQQPSRSRRRKRDQFISYLILQVHHIFIGFIRYFESSSPAGISWRRVRQKLTCIDEVAMSGWYGFGCWWKSIDAILWSPVMSKPIDYFRIIANPFPSNILVLKDLDVQRDHLLLIYHSLTISAHPMLY